MSSRSLKWILCSLLGLTGHLGVQQAMACTVTCQENQDTYLPENGTVVPANTAGLVVNTSEWTNELEELELHLLSADGSPERLVALERLGPYGFTFSFDEPLEPNRHYRLQHLDTCSWGEDRPMSAMEFQTGDVAELPQFLGHLNASDPSRSTFSIDSSSCVEEVNWPHVMIELELSDEALPWKDVLSYKTYVNGVPWGYRSHTGQVVAPGSSWEGRGRDRVFAVCHLEEPRGGLLPPGTHVITMEATIPGSETTIASESVTVTLGCDAPSHDSDSAPPNDDSDSSSDDSGSCAASAPTRPSPGFPFLMMLAMLGLMWRRR